MNRGRRSARLPALSALFTPLRLIGSFDDREMSKGAGSALLFRRLLFFSIRQRGRVTNGPLGNVLLSKERDQWGKGARTFSIN